MKVMVIVADAVEVAGGKVGILGGFWTRIQPGEANFSVLGILQMTVRELKPPHEFRLSLERVGSEPNPAWVLAGNVSASPVEGTTKNDAVNVFLPLTVRGPQLEEGLYELRLVVDGNKKGSYRFAVGPIHASEPGTSSDGL